MIKKYSGINIQFPISQLILSGQKTIETRTYPLPKKYIGVPLLVIETPGKSGKFKARISGLITFDGSFRYDSKKDFYKDLARHCVEPNSPWSWTGDAKWGWQISSVKLLRKTIEAPLNKGIVFTNNIRCDNL